MSLVFVENANEHIPLTNTGKQSDMLHNIPYLFIRLVIINE